MFNVRAYLTNTALAGFDLIVTAACFFAVQMKSGPASLVPVLILWLALSFYFGTYRSRRLDSPLADVVVIFKVGLTSWIVAQLGSPLLPGFDLADSVTFRFVGANVLGLTAARSALRIALRELRRRGYNVKRLVLIASEELGGRLEKKINRRSHYGYRIVARFVYAAGSDATLIESIRTFLKSEHVDDVILALPQHANALSAMLVSECETLGINVRI